MKIIIRDTSLYSIWLYLKINKISNFKFSSYLLIKPEFFTYKQIIKKQYENKSWSLKVCTKQSQLFSFHRVTYLAIVCMNCSDV